MNTLPNTRVLVIDDEERIRTSIDEILCPHESINHALLKASTALFGSLPENVPQRASTLVEFEVVQASSGEDGFAKVVHAAQNGEPFAVAFIDIRMAGWDGLETARKIRSVDEKIEIYFITAYSDHSMQKITEVAGVNVGYAVKPFASDEIRQMALKGVFEWNRLRDIESLLAEISESVGKSDTLELVLSAVIEQLTRLTDAKSAALVQKDSEDQFFDVGFESKYSAQSLLKSCGKDLSLLRELDSEQIFKQSEALLLVRIHSYIAVVLLTEASPLPAAKLYLLKLFLDYAHAAIENAKLKTALRKSERLSALGRVISEVSHDLRTPLAQIAAIVNMLRGTLPMPADSKELFDLIPLSLRDAQHYMDDILNYSKEIRLEKSECALEEFFDALSTKMSFLANEKGITLCFKAQERASASFDASRIERAITNLLNNSIDALASSNAEKPLVSIDARIEAKRLLLTISDNGPGIPQHILATLFEPFATSGKRSGTGLGLSIAKRMVEAHDGTIAVTSSTAGTSFMIEIPCE